jgi:hypothetical protein
VTSHRSSRNRGKSAVISRAKGDREVGRGQIGTIGFFRPLDKAQCISIEVLPEPRLKPFTWIREPIKIKVIAV